MKILPPFYQTILCKHLNQTQYLTLEILLLLIQCHRQVTLSTLASVFPQPIQENSRIRNLQRFLALPQLTAKLLWFPLIKYWIRQVESGKALNRQQYRHLKKLKRKIGGFWVVAIDRTQWKRRNVFMASLIWGRHALPLFWVEVGHRGNSNLLQQKHLLSQVIRLFKSRKHSVLVLGDREFHSPKFAQWLSSKGLSFCLRQRKSLHFKSSEEQEYRVIGEQKLKPGQSCFYLNVLCNKEDAIGPMNLAVYWKRKYRKKGPKEPWYILTNLTSLKQTLSFYRCRWGIEQMFKDAKTSGYNIENTKVNEKRFMALLLLVTIVYTFTTLYGLRLRDNTVEYYASRVKEDTDKTPRSSDFRFGLYGYAWLFSMELWQAWVHPLLALKSNKRLYFERGFQALSLMKQAL